MRFWFQSCRNVFVSSWLQPGFEVIKLEFILRLEIKRNDWLLAASSQSLRFILSLRLYSSFITSRPVLNSIFNVFHIDFLQYFIFNFSKQCSQ